MTVVGWSAGVDDSRGRYPRVRRVDLLSSWFLAGLELSAQRVYEPSIRARLRTTGVWQGGDDMRGRYPQVRRVGRHALADRDSLPTSPTAVVSWYKVCCSCMAGTIPVRRVMTVVPV